ncbi:AAA family ATPase [Bradyrhizobium sp. USDA 4508]
MIDLNGAPLQDEATQPRRGGGGGGSGRISAEDIRERLNADVRGFVLWLYSGRAFLHRTEARIGNILGEAGTSLCIELSGNRVGQWYDHATDEGGDLISLYRGFMGYAGTQDFDRSLKEIAADYFHEIVLEQPAWQAARRTTPNEKIAVNKIKWGDKPREEEEVLGAPIATFNYLDADGNIIAAVTRYEPKTFRPWSFRVVDGEKKWMIGSPQVRPLYHLPEISKATEIVLVEGEGKADALAKFGVVTTSIMGGANAVDKTNWLPLAMKKICIWADNDAAGRAFAQAAIAKLTSIGCKIWVVPVPATKPEKWDCADCIKAGEDPMAILASAVEINGKPEGPPIYDYLDIRGIKSKPDPVWLIDGLVNERSLGFIYGPPGSLKTFIALGMALSFVTNQPKWWDRAINRNGAVIYLCREGVASLKFRIMAWEQFHSAETDDAPFFLIESNINFMKVEDINKLLVTVKAIVDKIQQPIAAVFVDTVSRVLPGAKENAQEDMSLFIAACDAVQQTFGCVVLGVHHTNKEGGFRGSTVMPGAGDFLIETRREAGAMTGSIFAAKIKDGEDGWEQGFRAEKIAVSSNKLSLVVVPVHDQGKREGVGWPDRTVCKEILAAIHDQWMSGKPWCYAANSSRAAVPNIAKRWNLKPDVAADILKTWTARDVIVEDIRDVHNHIKGYRKLCEI